MNYNKITIADGARAELHDTLRLTGAEISVNELPAGGGVPFVHSHKQNEEIYAVDLKANDWLRISPSAKRQIFAAADKPLKYLCIQVKVNSLEGYTLTDAVL